MRPIYLMTRKVPNHQSNRQKQKVPGTGYGGDSSLRFSLVLVRYAGYAVSKTIIKNTGQLRLDFLADRSTKEGGLEAPTRWTHPEGYTFCSNGS